MASRKNNSFDEDFGATTPDLSDLATRKRLSPAAITAMTKLAELWRLKDADVRALLGGISERTWMRMKAGKWAMPLSQRRLTRISLLLGIYKGLNQLYSRPLADQWMWLPNKSQPYRGVQPISFILKGGMAALRSMRHDIQALCGSA